MHKFSRGIGSNSKDFQPKTIKELGITIQDFCISTTKYWEKLICSDFLFVSKSLEHEVWFQITSHTEREHKNVIEFYYFFVTNEILVLYTVVT